jgi:HlyD family type I secretion membrane fusion protein
MSPLAWLALPNFASGRAHAPGPDCARPIVWGLGIAVLFVGGFLVWAYLAPLSRAAVTTGEVRVESHRKTVQHMEGGVIREILVHEGEMVRNGQLLVRIDDTATASALAALRSQHEELEAQAARLVAERDGASSLSFPADLAGPCTRPGNVCDSQQHIFTQRQQALKDQIGILNLKVDELQSEIVGHRAQVASQASQIDIINEPIKAVAPLVQQQLLPRPRLLTLQQQAASLEGSQGEQNAEIAKARQSIGETQMQIPALINQHPTDIASDLRDTEDKLADVQQKIRAAADVLRRTDVVAPQAGKVVNLRYYTPGGVVKPGDAILDIVPQNDNPIVEAHVRPLDIEHVHPGLAAQVRLVAYNLRTTPTITGTVDYVSADTLTNEHTDQSYYVANVVLNAHDLARLDRVRLYPGMPVEVMIITGERTMLQYLLDPLRDSLARAFRES